MASYNAERLIAASIDSVIGQTLKDWELIIVDDASIDATVDVIADAQRRDHRIRLVAQDTNRGPAHARNVALDRASGELIAFIDSDDIWYPEKTVKQVAVMNRHRADIAYTAYKRRLDGEQGGTLVTVPERVTYRTMLRRNYIACSTAMVRRSTCGEARMPEIPLRADHGYWLALLRDGSRSAIGIREPLMWYRLHRDSLSANKLVAARYSWKLLREVERFGLAKSLWLFSGYAFEALKLRLVASTR